MTREKAVRFGPHSTLTGIVSEAPGRAHAARLGFIMVNAGLLHRVGPSRLHVALARELAARGTIALRFDLSGIGDSDARRDTRPFGEGVARDIQDAMDCLAATYGVRLFVLFGICAGAHVALEAAVDERVVGVVTVDGYAYRTVRYYWEYYRPRLLRLGSWLSFGRRQVRRVGRVMGVQSSSGGSGAWSSTFQASFPPRQELAARLAMLVGRRVHQVYLFTAAHEMRYSYRGQFRDMFRSVDFGDLLREEHLVDTGHMFEDFGQQRNLVRSISDWVGEMQSVIADREQPPSMSASRSGRSAPLVTGS